jgi:hypothetical protein
MAHVDWMIRTKQLGTCSCDYGCPCEFNAPPTRLPCEGVMAMEITEGYYRDLRLDGLRTAAVYQWPGPIHEGGGTWWSIIDKSASEQQVEALFRILGGQDQEPNTGFAIFAATVDHEPEPLFAAIDFEWNISERTGRFVVSDVLEANIEPIRNPVTDDPHFIAIHPHDGFEFREAEMASSNFWARGELPQRYQKRFASITYVTYGPNGIIPNESLPERRA